MSNRDGEYTIWALGDSVMWGQGLASGDRFSDLVTAWLSAQKPDGAVLASLARSGAILDSAATPWDPSAHASLLFGELPRTCPSIRTQIEIAGGSAGYGPYLDPADWDPDFWRAQKQQVRSEIAAWGSKGPDLILIDGGANDFDALQIVLPWDLGEPDKRCGASGATSAAERILGAARGAGRDAVLRGRYTLPELPATGDAWFTARIDRLVLGRMVPTLQRVKSLFPRSAVVVTGYYPIFTPGSVPALAASAESLASALLQLPSRGQARAAALLWALHSELDLEATANRIVQQSALWAAYGAQALQRAIDAAGGGCRLAVPDWDDHGALAPESWLWTLTDAADDVVQMLLWLLGWAPAPTIPAASGVGGRETASSTLDFAAGYALGSTMATDDAQTRRGLAALQYYELSATGRGDPGATGAGGFETSIASVGHPNPTGAAAYARTIQQLLS